MTRSLLKLGLLRSQRLLQSLASLLRSLVRTSLSRKMMKTRRIKKKKFQKKLKKTKRKLKAADLKLVISIVHI